MELLVDDLGATLFRMDHYGKSNWADPDDTKDASVLSPASLERIHAGREFKDAASMGAWLNSRGIEPYVTISGIVPRWMCGPDGRTLADYDAFAEMASSYAEWLRKKAGVRFSLFGPLNETDLGPPEGPVVAPADFPRALAAVARALDRRGLGDLKLVAAEQGTFNLDFATAILADRVLAGRLGVFGIHAYSDFHSDSLVKLFSDHLGADHRCALWMTEYGDLDETGEREWFVAWSSTDRLLRLLEDGLNAALVWDAFDNYHDHDEAWSLFGLLRRGRKIYTPKKRYFAAKQVYRFVRPGFQRIGTRSDAQAIRTVAFLGAENQTVVGMNMGGTDLMLDVVLEGLQDAGRRTVDVWRTSPDENCHRISREPVVGKSYPYLGIPVAAPAGSIITVTTITS
jgi:O-glycosyl hydrolase